MATVELEVKILWAEDKMAWTVVGGRKTGHGSPTLNSVLRMGAPRSTSIQAPHPRLLLHSVSRWQLYLFEHLVRVLQMGNGLATASVLNEGGGWV